MAGFLLGLANGASCLAFCAPVLVPVMLAEGRRAGPSAMLLARFLAGRLVGYLAFGTIAGVAGRTLRLTQGGHADVGFGLVYCGLAVLLLAYGLRRARPDVPGAPCSAGGILGRARRLAGQRPWLLPAALGLLTGLNLCPPFALALAGAAGQGSIVGAVLFFLSFFAGTSLFFLPVPGLGRFGRHRALREVARLAAAVTGAFYLYRGLVLSYGGFVHS